MRSINRLQVLIAVAILLACAAIGIGYLSLIETHKVSVPVHERDNNLVLAPIAPTVARQSNSPPAPNSSSEAIGVARAENRQQKLERLAASPKPEDRFEAYGAIFNCVQSQRLTPQLIQEAPNNGPQMNADVSAACNGLTASLIAQRFSLIERLTKEGFRGAATSYINEAPDGTPFEEAARDGNHQAWLMHAVQYLDNAAKSGDMLAISDAGMMFQRMPGKEYDALAYRVAGIEVQRRQESNSPEFDRMISELAKAAVASGLDGAKVQRAIDDGRQLSKIAK